MQTRSGIVHKHHAWTLKVKKMEIKKGEVQTWEEWAKSSRGGMECEVCLVYKVRWIRNDVKLWVAAGEGSRCPQN